MKGPHEVLLFWMMMFVVFVITMFTCQGVVTMLRDQSSYRRWRGGHWVKYHFGWVKVSADEYDDILESRRGMEPQYMEHYQEEIRK